MLEDGFVRDMMRVLCYRHRNRSLQPAAAGHTAVAALAVVVVVAASAAGIAAADNAAVGRNFLAAYIAGLQPGFVAECVLAVVFPQFPADIFQSQGQDRFSHLLPGFALLRFQVASAHSNPASHALEHGAVHSEQIPDRSCSEEEYCHNRSSRKHTGFVSDSVHRTGNFVWMTLVAVQTHQRRYHPPQRKHLAVDYQRDFFAGVVVGVE